MCPPFGPAGSSSGTRTNFWLQDHESRFKMDICRSTTSSNRRIGRPPISQILGLTALDTYDQTLAIIQDYARKRHSGQAVFKQMGYSR